VFSPVIGNRITAFCNHALRIDSYVVEPDYSSLKFQYGMPLLLRPILKFLKSSNLKACETH